MPIILGRIMLALLLVALGGCAQRVPEPAVVPTAPHISWIVTTETNRSSLREVCRSDPRTPCVLPASTAATKQLATVRLFLHPAPTDTTYTGTISASFFHGAAERVHESKIDATVRRGAAPYGTSVTDIVTETAGQYVVRIQLRAGPPGQPDSRPLEDEIAVTVK